MNPTDPDDIGLTGQMRLARIEGMLDRLMDKVDVINTAARDALALTAAEKLKNETESDDVRQRLRALELKFYVIAAGIVTAIGLLVYQGGTR